MRIMVIVAAMCLFFGASANAQMSDQQLYVQYKQFAATKEVAATSGVSQEREVRCKNRSWTSDRRERCRKDWEDYADQLLREKVLINLASDLIMLKRDDPVRTSIDLTKILNEYTASDKDSTKKYEQLKIDYPVSPGKSAQAN